ncbi:hypothetical protein E2C01_056602 [Portunus trituberculatus]|uniref:Uncharacterized protein n=1 Tax=Portunus trituberculatus TaxID=210409 RepID=A0A5B7GZM7_PORTR|nr:hypothetical protein [Portunus trituberculatus]
MEHSFLHTMRLYTYYGRVPFTHDTCLFTHRALHGGHTRYKCDPLIQKKGCRDLRVHWNDRLN